MILPSVGDSRRKFSSRNSSGHMHTFIWSYSQPGHKTMQPLLLCVILMVTCNVVFVAPGKILMLPYNGEGSHYSSMAIIGESLVSNGHNVSFLLSDVFQFRARNPSHASIFTFEIYPHHLGEQGWYRRRTSENERVMSGNNVASEILVSFNDVMRNFSLDCEDILKDFNLRERLVNASFDIAIVDPTSFCNVVVAQMLRIPYCVFVPISVVPNLARFFSTPVNPAYIPSWQSGNPLRMSFLQRVNNVLLDLSWSVFFNMVFFPLYDGLRAVYNVRPDVDIRTGMTDSMFYLNFADWTLEHPVVFPPNVIGSVGLNLLDEKQNLNKEWTIFMEEQGDNVILISFGTFVRGLPRRIIQKLSLALSKLPHTVIWQMPETLTLEHRSENIFVFAWVPMPALLAHNKTRLLISHGGINSMYEALYYSKPVLAFPLFGDQYDLGRRITDKKMGLSLDVHTSTTGEIVGAINELIVRSCYRNQSGLLGRMYNDLPFKAREVLPFYVEQTLRSKAMLFQRCKGQSMNFVTYHLIDVMSAIVLLAVTLLYITMLCFKYLFRFVHSVCTYLKARPF